MSIKFLVLGGGGILGFGGGGGSADFIFMGARIFLILNYVTKMRCSKKIIPKLFVHSGPQSWKKQVLKS